MSLVKPCCGAALTNLKAVNEGNCKRKQIDGLAVDSPEETTVHC